VRVAGRSSAPGVQSSGDQVGTRWGSGGDQVGRRLEARVDHHVRYVHTGTTNTCTAQHPPQALYIV